MNYTIKACRLIYSLAGFELTRLLFPRLIWTIHEDHELPIEYGPKRNEESTFDSLIAKTLVWINEKHGLRKIPIFKWFFTSIPTTTKEVQT